MMEADWMGDPNMYPEGSDYLVGYIREHKLGEYLNLIKESKKVHGAFAAIDAGHR